MELRHLRYFIAVADSLSFSRAAKSLYISQSTLSHQIAQLERELGFSLFDRTGRSIKLTPRGCAILEASKALLRQADKLAQLASSDFSTRRKSRIVIGYDYFAVVNPLIHYAITVTCITMRAKGFSIELFFKPINLNTLATALRKNRIDIAIILQNHKPINQLNNYICLSSDEMVYATFSEQDIPDNHDSLRSIIKSRPLYFPEHEAIGLNMIIKLISNLNLQPEIQFLDSIDTINLLVSSGNGAMIIPSFARKAHNKVRYLHFNSTEALLYTYAVWSKSNSNDLIAHFLNELSDVIDAYKLKDISRA
ncbi:MAG: LysR family transcriptional regulator [Oscillospiraceae bacterium]|jgi:DNA-binding transcriptional LysR family regulator